MRSETRLAMGAVGRPGERECRLGQPGSCVMSSRARCCGRAIGIMRLAYENEVAHPPSTSHLGLDPRNFWSTKMGLAGASADELARTKSALDAFLSDAAKLAAVRKVLAEAQGLTEEQRHVLAILEKTFKVGGSTRVG